MLLIILVLISCKDYDKSIKITSYSHENTFMIKKNLSRPQIINKLKNENFDILIIGGGATGAGALLEASSRGLKAALIEQSDFASETSSRSTKLIHGGVRYLENAVKKLDLKEYELVRDALSERQYFLQNAPHLSNPLAIITPVYSWFDAIYYWMGLKTYDFVAGKASFGKSEFLSYKETISLFPKINKENLKGSVRYYDGQFNDARMNLALILTAFEQGGLALNYAKVTSLIKEQETIKGAIIKDVLTDEKLVINAKVVINATGVFADSIRQMDDAAAHKLMEVSQGSHILLPPNLVPKNTGLIIPKTKDGRVLFLLPWLDKTLVGTTDEKAEIIQNPHATKAEIDYILEHVSQILDQKIAPKQVLASFSGLRPLVKPSEHVSNTASISRDHFIEVSKSHLITIVGGKWTTYRKMGEDVINQAIKTANLSSKNTSITKNLKLVGAKFYDPSLKYENLDEDIVLHLVSNYGDQVNSVINIDNKTKLTKIISNYPFIEAEVIYAVRYEYAITPLDIILRRIRLGILDTNSAIKSLNKITEIMSEELNWSSEKTNQELSNSLLFLQKINYS